MSAGGGPGDQGGSVGNGASPKLGPAKWCLNQRDVHVVFHAECWPSISVVSYTKTRIEFKVKPNIPELSRQKGIPEKKIADACVFAAAELTTDLTGLVACKDLTMKRIGQTISMFPRKGTFDVDLIEERLKTGLPIEW